MRILFVTPHPPHPTQGGAAIRNWHLIDAARRSGREVDLLTFGTFQSDGCEAVSFPHPLVEPSLAARARDLALNREPDLVRRLGAHTLRGQVEMRTHAGHYDVIQVEGLEMWPSLPETDIPVIYDAHNAEATLQRRIARQAVRDRDAVRALYSTIQMRKLRTYEAAAMRRAAVTIAVSQSDAEALHHLAPGPQIEVVPIGVDTAHYVPRIVATAPDTAFDVLFTGTLDYQANADAVTWFIREVWPRIRALKPDARLGIVGRGPSRSLLRLNGRQGIGVTGAVTDDRPYMASTSVYVLPIRVGAGVRVKLLNAMSMACAVVATPIAAEGVAVVDGEHCVIADATASSFAAAVLKLLDNPERQQRLGSAARDHMCAAYDWSICTPKLLAIYTRLERGRD